MASLSQANAESSSHFPGGGGVGCGPQPCRAGGLVLCTCVYLPRAHSVSRLNLLPGRTHLFCILSVFSISNYLCQPSVFSSPCPSCSFIYHIYFPVPSVWAIGSLAFPHCPNFFICLFQCIPPFLLTATEDLVGMRSLRRT